MPKAIALFSGGLDSTLAVLAVGRQGIDVQAVRFLTPFDPDISAGRPNAVSLQRNSGLLLPSTVLMKRFLISSKTLRMVTGKT